jgi:hypothetical protein
MVFSSGPEHQFVVLGRIGTPSLTEKISGRSLKVMPANEQ